MILPIIVRRCLPGPVPERLFAPEGPRRLRREAGESEPALPPWSGVIAPRLRRLPQRRLCGRRVAVADDFHSRLLGLAGLDAADVGAGLLIPGCASIHTFGMRFELDVVFLDRRERPLARRLRVPPRRLLWHRGAAAVLELPAAGGESSMAAGA